MKKYLGDGCYVDIEHGTLKLTTENGYGVSNTIFLEPAMLAGLVDYLRRHEAKTDGNYWAICGGRCGD